MHISICRGRAPRKLHALHAPEDGPDACAGMLLSRLQVQAAALWNAINQRSILLPAVFVFLWQVRGACCLIAVHHDHSRRSFLAERIVSISSAPLLVAAALLPCLAWKEGRDQPARLQESL